MLIHALGWITSSFGQALPLPCLLQCPVFLPAHAWNSFPLGTNVTISDHLSCYAPWACEGTPSIILGIMEVMSTWKFVILTGYCHICSQRGRIPMQVWAMKEAWEGRGPIEWTCNLAPRPHSSHISRIIFACCEVFVRKLYMQSEECPMMNSVGTFSE